MIQYIKLMVMFFKIGLFSFGGGYAMLPLIYNEIERLSLVTIAEFDNLVAISQMTPGPIAVNAATYVGYKAAGFWGAAFATLGVSLPSFILIIIISAFFNKFKSSRIVQAVLSGIRPATVGLIGSAVILLSKTSIFDKKLFSVEALSQPLKFIHFPALAVFTLTIICATKFKMSPITLTILAGVVGAFIM